MPRSLIIFLLVCALMAGGTLLARQIRLERARTAESHVQAARYAAAIVACANGKRFAIAELVLYCKRVPS